MIEIEDDFLSPSEFEGVLFLADFDAENLVKTFWAGVLKLRKDSIFWKRLSPEYILQIWNLKFWK